MRSRDPAIAEPGPCAGCGEYAHEQLFRSRVVMHVTVLDAASNQYFRYPPAILSGMRTALYFA